jgi:nitrogen fixation NifU-like protein
MAEGYSETTLDHYESPRNSVLLADANAIATLTNPVCGDALTLTLRFSDSVVNAAGYEVKGCVAATAAASIMSQLIIGRTYADLEILTAGQLEAALGGLPPGRAHGAILAAETLAAAIEDYSARAGGTADVEGHAL